LKASWQKQIIASNGYRELGMFDGAANALEEIEPEDNRNTVAAILPSRGIKRPTMSNMSEAARYLSHDVLS
jgi:hypothetical protein